MYRNIRDLREDADLTQQQVADILHCSQQVYANYELGQRDIPTGILISLARLHNTSTDYILGLTDERNRIQRNDALGRKPQQTDGQIVDE